jgi:hypothetical protein
MYRRDSFLLLLIALALAAGAQCVAERREPAPAPAPMVDDGAWLEGVKLALIIDHPDPDADMPIDYFHDRMWR